VTGEARDVNKSSQQCLRWKLNYGEQTRFIMKA